MTFEDQLREVVAAAVAPLAEQMRTQAAELRQLRAVLPPPMGSKKDAARILHVSEKSVDRAIARGDIEVKRVGSRVLIDLSKLHVDSDEDEVASRRAAGRR